MKPDDFLSLAIRLAGSSGEAERRSAVSRAYYGSFHIARVFLMACGVRCPQSAAAHDAISKSLQNCGDLDVEIAGDQLNTLRTARNLADYRLDDEKFRDAAYLRVQLARAQQIQVILSQAGGRLEEIRGPLRSYARDVLRLSVESDA